MNNKGQIFLITAILVIIVISGLIGVANYASAGDEPETFYDLSKEVGFETKKVLDWGVFNNEDIDSVTEKFLFDYSNYIGEEEVVFVYGDSLDIKALYFKDENIGSVKLKTGSNRGIEINRRTGKQADDIIFDGDRVIVVIDGINYTFDLRQGQNFFFVIIKERENERFVAKG